MHTILCFENLKGRDHLEDLCVDGKILEWIFGETGWEDVDWMQLDQDTDHWQALVNMIMKLQVP
jgi:hypothetical protein